MLSNEERAELIARIREDQLFERSKVGGSPEGDRGLVVFTHGYMSKPADYTELLVDLMDDEKGSLTCCDLLVTCSPVARPIRAL